MRSKLIAGFSIAGGCILLLFIGFLIGAFRSQTPQPPPPPTSQPPATNIEQKATDKTKSTEAPPVPKDSPTSTPSTLAPDMDALDAFFKESKKKAQATFSKNILENDQIIAIQLGSDHATVLASPDTTRFLVLPDGNTLDLETRVSRAHELRPALASAEVTPDHFGLKLWHREKKGTPIYLDGTKTYHPRNAVFSPDSKHIAALCHNQIVAGVYRDQIVVWDASTGLETARMTGDARASRLFFASGNKWLVSISNTNTIDKHGQLVIWDRNSGAKLYSGNIVRYSSWVFSSSLEYFAFTNMKEDKQGILTVVSTRTWATVATIDSFVGSLAFSADDTLVCGRPLVKWNPQPIWGNLWPEFSEDVKVWNVKSGKETTTDPREVVHSQTTSLQWHISYGSATKKAVYSLGSPVECEELSVSKKGVNSPKVIKFQKSLKIPKVAISSNGKYIALVTEDVGQWQYAESSFYYGKQKVSIWNLDSETEMLSIQTNHIYNLVFDPQDLHLILVEREYSPMTNEWQFCATIKICDIGAGGSP